MKKVRKRHSVRVFAVLYRESGRKAWTTLEAHAIHSSAITSMEYERAKNGALEYKVVPGSLWITQAHMAAPPMGPTALRRHSPK